MKSFLVAFWVVALLSSTLFAETDLIVPPQAATPEQTPLPVAADDCNFEVMVKKSDATPHIGWSGQIFSVATAKPMDMVNPERLRFRLEPGNYMLMLDFMTDVPAEYKGKRPFTFAVKPEQKTVLIITVGGEFPDMEKDVKRTTIGEDYYNFVLASPDLQLCKTACEKDRNCGAYTYTYHGVKKIARCYLIRGAGTPSPAVYDQPHPDNRCISGVIQRDPSPFQMKITFESLSGQALETTPTPAMSLENQKY
ncbi:hypothetical protein U14_02789 [Candidatus Moduliflexus flocculans]|uniref:Apple domain-containing protein n=1 Tax=Candidatus Moduliflexus flocculans TaxID=1499966 RepID=A0A081BMC8_9BACT|nr:hypothetical protein U14_02789 [Candidatus Moduliflexus flocculans]